MFELPLTSTLLEVWLMVPDTWVLTSVFQPPPHTAAPSQMPPTFWQPWLQKQ